VSDRATSAARCEGAGLHNRGQALTSIAMTTSDIAALAAGIRAKLTAPGAEFVNRRASLTDWLRHSARYGEDEYLVLGEQRVGYRQHVAAVAALAAELDRRGVRPGDRVVILAANSPAWVTSFWAIASLGAVTMAGNAWWTEREAAHSLERGAPVLAITDLKRAHLAGDLPRVDVAEIDAIIAAPPVAELSSTVMPEDDPAVIVYTSGTTGHPKGATHSHRNLLSVIEYHRMGDATIAGMAEAFGVAAKVSGRRILMSLPLFHIASLHNLAIPRLTSGDAVIIDSGRFDADRVLALIEREKISNWAVVPTMAHRIVEANPAGRYDLSSLTALSINSAPSSPALKERVKATLPGIAMTMIDSYGLTESSTAATVATSMDLTAFPASVGTAIATVSIEIHDTGGALLADGEEGEIWLRSQFTMLGYWNDPQATAAAIDAEGWLHTGDLGRLEDSRLFMASRRSDLILRGGENVYPAEIEAALDEHPAVTECAVFGVDDPDLGQRVAAIVVTSSSVSSAELAAFVGERVAYYKVPADWRLTSEPLTRTATGKVVRRTLTL
jgi:acyl-CoA synthetase (AMP-forming)/AMP-acid ligase II